MYSYSPGYHPVGTLLKGITSQPIEVRVLRGFAASPFCDVCRVIIYFKAHDPLVIEISESELSGENDTNEIVDYLKKDYPELFI